MVNVIWNPEIAGHRLEFAKMLAPLVAVLWKRKEPFGRVEAQTYMRTLKHVPAAILIEAVEASLVKDEWFPEPAKLLDHAAVILSAKRQEAQQKWLANCDHDSGFEEITVDGVTRLRRCECRRRLDVVLSEIGDPLARPRLRESNKEVTS